MGQGGASVFQKKKKNLLRKKKAKSRWTNHVGGWWTESEGKTLSANNEAG